MIETSDNRSHTTCIFRIKIRLFIELGCRMNTLLERANKLLMLFDPKPTDLSMLQRFGSRNDGGYLLLDDLSQNDFLISMGVADDVNFEKEAIEKIAGVDLYDNSISELPGEIKNSRFFAERIGGSGGTSLRKSIERVEPTFNLLLKMDIEGSEWETLDTATSLELGRFRQMVVEFHNFKDIENDEFFNRARRVLEKIDMTHFVMNSHPNNHGGVVLVENLLLPNVVEITFLARTHYSIDESKKAECFDQLANMNRPCSPICPEIYLQPPVDAKYLNLEVETFGVHTINLLNPQLNEMTELSRQLNEAKKINREITIQYNEILESKIWKLTSPIRDLKKLLNRLRLQTLRDLLVRRLKSMAKRVLRIRKVKYLLNRYLPPKLIRIIKRKLSGEKILFKKNRSKPTNTIWDPEKESLRKSISDMLE